MKRSMRFYLSVVTLCCINSYQVLAQGTVEGLPQTRGLDINNRAYGYFTEIVAPSKEIEGSTYLNDNWVKGKINFVDGKEIRNIEMRYDLIADQIEVKIEGSLKGVKGQNVKTLTFYNDQTHTVEVFVNSRYCKETSTQPPSFYKVISSGEWSLLEKIEIQYIGPNYNPVLGVGKQHGEYVKKRKLYITNGGTILMVTRKKKKFFESFGEQCHSVTAFVKNENLNLKDSRDIKMIVDFLNKNT